MSFSEDQSENTEKITIKKSTYSKIIIGAVIAIAATTFFVGFLAGSASSDANSNYITKSDMQDLVETLEKKIDSVPAVAPAAAPAQPNLPSIIQVSLDDDPVKGDPTAPVTVIEFSDFQCPFCSRFYDQTLSQLEENYIDTGLVKLVYRDMPLTSIHPNAFSAHVAAECADEQNKFWEYHDMLFENQAEWNRLASDNLSSKLAEYASTLELETSSFETCVTSQKISDEVTADGAQARTYGAT